jgi:hypothetical protein
MLIKCTRLLSRLKDVKTTNDIYDHMRSLMRRDLLKSPQIVKGVMNSYLFPKAQGITALSLTYT